MRLLTSQVWLMLEKFEMYYFQCKIIVILELNCLMFAVPNTNNNKKKHLFSLSYIFFIIKIRNYYMKFR